MPEYETTNKLSGIFDGEQHWFLPGELFPEDGATKIIDGFEELEEEEELSPFESPSQTPILRETGRARSDLDKKRFPLADTEQAWGCFSIALTAFANIVEISKKQYQHVWPGQGSDQGEVRWSLATDEHITERM